MMWLSNQLAPEASPSHLIISFYHISDLKRFLSEHRFHFSNAYSALLPPINIQTLQMIRVDEGRVLNAFIEHYLAAFPNFSMGEILYKIFESVLQSLPLQSNTW